MKKKITIFGSTGSVGVSTLDIITAHKEKFEIVGLTINQNYKKLLEQVELFKPKVVAIKSEFAYKEFCKQYSGKNLKILSGKSCLIDVLDFDADFVMAGIVGAAGLMPVLEAAKKGLVIGLANKESLVCSGSILKRIVLAHGAKLLPIDSEHNAIFQVLDSKNKSQIDKIILTASGGPFFGRNRDELKNVSPKEAIKHPNWNMGRKISVDSATLMNKGLEVIEAYYLFDFSVDKIDVLIHPQSIIHSCVEYSDGSILAQMGTPDMKTPIAYALGYPNRISAPIKKLSLDMVKELTFQLPDHKTFPLLNLAIEAIKIEKNAPTILNAANEVAVQAFLENKISFLSISKIVDLTLNKANICSIKSIDEILQEDKSARILASSFVASNMN
ncbi:MAG: 1-deoxy-D-xylulose-5-phosphate reductoisomerase [Rickettsiales bacterium]|nr:1-deoxy-D-xylulose-5-phosphate reductoisomerase [Rickettsiales bacterium]